MRFFSSSALVALLCVGASAQPQPPLPVGIGCSTVYFIDHDCDGRGTGKKSSGVYPLGILDPSYAPGTYTTGDLPDADDEDPNVNDTRSWQKVYGSDNAALVNFLALRKHFYNSGRIFYFDQAGDDATGLVNRPDKPFRHMTAAITKALSDWQGGVLVVGDGKWTDLNFVYGGGGVNTNQISGSAGHPLYIMAYPGARAEISNVYNYVFNNNLTYKPYKDVGYITFDGLIFRDTKYGNDYGMKYADTDHMQVINCEFAGFGDAIFAADHTFLWDVRFNVFHDNFHHSIYFGHAGNSPYGAADVDFADYEARYLAGTSVGADHDMVAYGNVSYNDGSYGYEPFHINLIGYNILIDSNFISYGGGASCIQFQFGVYDSIIQNNVCLAGGTSGIVLSIYGGDGAATIRRITIRHNSIYQAPYKILIRGVYPGGCMAFNDFTANTPPRWIKDVVIEANVCAYDTVMPNNYTFLAFLRDSYPDTFTIRNNVFFSLTPGVYTPALEVSNATGGGLGTYYNVAQFMTYAFQENTGNRFVSPLFASASKSFVTTPGLFDLRPLAGSPLIGAATAGPVTLDARGNARKSTPDIGAYEYIAPAPTSTLKSGSGILSGRK